MKSKEKKEEIYPTRRFVADVWSSVWPYKGKFWSATISRIMADLMDLYPPYALALIVNFFGEYSPGASLSPLYRIFFLMLLAVTVRHVAMYYARSTMFRVSEKAVLDAQHQAMEHLMLLDMSWHEKENAGSKFKRIERGAESLNQVLRIWISNIINIAINLIGIVIILFGFDRTMGMAVAFFMVTYYAISNFYRSRAVLASNVTNAKEEYRSGILFESVNNIRSVKVMSMADKVLDTISSNADNLLKAIYERVHWFQFGNFMRNSYGSLFYTGIMLFIVQGIVQGTYQIGFLVLFSGYFSKVWVSVMDLSDAAEQLAVAKNALARMKKVMNAPITIGNESGKVSFPSEWRSISVKNVSFSYEDKSVLRDMSFQIRRGEKVGIVGLSGAGKSTLFKLLLKEHESYTGEIAFDDVDIKSIGTKDYFEHVAVVLQDTELFNQTLRENITMTNQKEENNEELFENAIDVAHVREFMEKLPDGADTMVGEKGIKLSGGEKQRVGIARAVFKRPQIFLLDEATSHLDIESEEKIQASLHTFFRSVTAIVIAHRLTTIKEMDRILVVEDGRVLESGSFAELYAAKGRFFDLWEKQNL